MVLRRVISPGSMLRIALWIVAGGVFETKLVGILLYPVLEKGR
jgi:hypothetical protein